jgi:hypothetical protein
MGNWDAVATYDKLVTICVRFMIRSGIQNAFYETFLFFLAVSIVQM